MRYAFLARTSGHRNGSFPPHRTALRQKASSAGGTRSSTDAAVSNPAQDILNLAGSKLGVYDRERSYTAQRVIRPLKPVNGHLTVAEKVCRQRDQPRQAVKPVQIRTEPNGPGSFCVAGSEATDQDCWRSPAMRARSR
jgi:hypothetical protein